MLKISPYSIQEIFYFLNIDSLHECCLVTKRWKKIITSDSFWSSKFKKTSSSSYHSGPYFNFSGYKPYLDTLDTEKFPIITFKEMKSIAQKLENPQKLKILEIKASSVHFNQVPSRLLYYDDLFWSSLPNNSKDSDEHLTCELSEESLIFSISFKTYRSINQEGVTYPPRLVKVSTGYTKECKDYESGEFEVGLTENYNTISVLPKLLPAKFVKIHLIGKQSQEPGTEKWYSVLRFLEIVGYPLEKSNDPILTMCRKRQFKKISNDLTPFYLERLEKFGMIVNYLERFNSHQNDTISYFFEIYKDQIQRPEFKTMFCEILGNYFLERGEFDLAMMHYVKVLDIWGIVKVYIVTQQFQNVRNFMDENRSRRPGINWVVKTAKMLGGTDLENIVIEEFKQEISLLV